MFKFDKIGYWSEIKLDILREYAKAYSTILSAQRSLTHVYIDAFAGGGHHVSRTTKEVVPGSPINALQIKPPFDEYFFIDLNESKVKALEDIARTNSSIHVLEGDCNSLLLDKVFPRVRREDFRRGLCVLDPYGLHLDWEVIKKAGEMNSIDIFLNFPVADMNRNVLWRNPDKVSETQLERMNRFWGDSSWRKSAYDTDNLFHFEEKTDNKIIVEAFQKRLKDVAGFKCVPDPIPMRNSKGSTVYFLFFASPKLVAAKIVRHIFDKYRNKMT